MFYAFHKSDFQEKRINTAAGKYSIVEFHAC